MHTRFISAPLTLFVVIAGASGVAAQSVTVTPSVTIDPKVQVDLDQLQSKLEALGSRTFDLGKDKNFNLEIATTLHAKLEEQFLKMQAKPMPPRGKVDNNEDRLYQAGTRALESSRWDEAVMQFQRVVAMSGTRADGATYWIAWAQNKQGNSAAALESLAKLRQTYANSKWIAEARALEVEIRQAAGQPVRPENVQDDELKLMALNSLVRADEQRAVPMIDKILRGTGSPKLKERALFVLAQNGTPQARQIVTDIAKGGGNPDLQSKAVSYLGVMGGPESKQALLEIYKSSTNLDVKRNILRAFMAAGDRARLLDVAKTEQSADLRAEAVQQLGAMGAQDELSQLYQTETSPEVRKRIIQSMFAGHNEAKLTQLLRSETDPDLKRSIVQNLGMMPSPGSVEALSAVYASDKDEAVRRAVVDALAQQRNSKALIELAKKESDPQMKKRIVERLSNLKSTEATDYFLELLSKP